MAYCYIRPFFVVPFRGRRRLVCRLRCRSWPSHRRLRVEESVLSLGRPVCHAPVRGRSALHTLRRFRRRRPPEVAPPLPPRWIDGVRAGQCNVVCRVPFSRRSTSPLTTIRCVTACAVMHHVRTWCTALPSSSRPKPQHLLSSLVHRPTALLVVPTRRHFVR